MRLSSELCVALVAGLLALCAADVEFLKPLPKGTLLTGNDRNCPAYPPFNDTVNHAGDFAQAKATEFHKPSIALRHGIFSKYIFTAHIAALQLNTNVGGRTDFMFAQLEYTFSNIDMKLFGLQAFKETDGETEKGYWVPQGDYMDIPATPYKNESHFVFTPDFSGCSLTITPFKNEKRDMLRVRHVEGDKEDQQFNKLPEDKKKGNVTYAMQYTDYVYCELGDVPVENRKGFAYMQYSEGYWRLFYQKEIDPMTITSSVPELKKGRVHKAPVSQPFYTKDKRPVSKVAEVRQFRVPKTEKRFRRPANV